MNNLLMLTLLTLCLLQIPTHSKPKLHLIETEDKAKETDYRHGFDYEDADEEHGEDYSNQPYHPARPIYHRPAPAPYHRPAPAPYHHPY